MHGVRVSKAKGWGSLLGGQGLNLCGVPSLKDEPARVPDYGHPPERNVIHVPLPRHKVDQIAGRGHGSSTAHPGNRGREGTGARRPQESRRGCKREYGLDAICTGALASVYQKTRVERICSELELECISPLWHLDPETHLRNLLRDGFLVTIVSVSALGLDQSWLGRIIDEEAISELVKLGSRYGFHVGFEGGEGETFVLDCPLFDRRIEILRSEKHWEGDAGRLEINEARLAEKLG